MKKPRTVFYLGGSLHGRIEQVRWGLGEYARVPLYMHRFLSSPDWVWHYPSEYYRYVGYNHKTHTAFALYSGIRSDGIGRQKELTP